MKPGPWSHDDLLRWLVTTVLAVAVCTIAWWCAATRASLADQLAFANLGVAGLVLGSHAHATLFLRGRRTIGVRRRRLLDPAVDGRVAPLVPVRAAGELVAGPGLERYHRPDCALASGRGWAATDPAEHLAAGRRPCGVCRS